MVQKSSSRSAIEWASSALLARCRGVVARSSRGGWQLADRRLRYDTTLLLLLRLQSFAAQFARTKGEGKIAVTLLCFVCHTDH
eukprot:728140-Amphidinium_carterae.1